MSTVTKSCSLASFPRAFTTNAFHISGLIPPHSTTHFGRFSGIHLEHLPFHSEITWDLLCGIEREGGDGRGCHIIPNAQLLRQSQYCILHGSVFSCRGGRLLRTLVLLSLFRVDVCRKVSKPFKGELIRFDNATVDEMCELCFPGDFVACRTDMTVLCFL